MDIKLTKMKVELQCVNEGITELERINALDLNNFNSKVLNCKFGKAIGHTVEYTGYKHGFQQFTVHCKNCTIPHEPDKHGYSSVMYADSFRRIRVEFPHDAKSFRLDVNAFKLAVQEELAALKETKTEFEKGIAEFDTDWEKINRLVVQIKTEYQALAKTLPPVMRLYLAEQCRNLSY